MKYHMMKESIIRRINTALLFAGGEPAEQQPMRPWQYVQMEYERVGLVPPAVIPDFASMEDAQIWMCLDRRYNNRLLAERYQQAV